MTVGPVERWSSSAAYEQYVGRWSRAVAVEFVDWLAMPARLAWLDVGCGTGSVTSTVVQRAAPTRVTGVDPSLRYVLEARARLKTATAAFVAARAEQLPFDDGSFDAIVSGLVLNFVPAPQEAVMEMMRVVRPGGVVSVYVWDYAAGMQLMRVFWDAAVALDSAAAALDEGRRFPLCQADRLGTLFRDCALDQVETRAIDVATRFENFDDYWTPFLGGQGPAPGYVMGLTDERRSRLRDALHRMLPIGPDGSIALTARAWAVRGRRRIPTPLQHSR